MAWTCDIDHEIVAAYLTSDHYIIYATFALSCPDMAPTLPPTKRFHYRQTAPIPLVNTFSDKSNPNTKQWCAPNTLGILPITTFRPMRSCMTPLPWRMTTHEYSTTFSRHHNTWSIWIISLQHCTSPTIPEHHHQILRTLPHVHLLCDTSSIKPVTVGNGALNRWWPPPN